MSPRNSRHHLVNYFSWEFWGLQIFEAVWITYVLFYDWKLALNVYVYFSKSTIYLQSTECKKVYISICLFVLKHSEPFCFLSSIHPLYHEESSHSLLSFLSILLHNHSPLLSLFLELPLQNPEHPPPSPQWNKKEKFSLFMCSSPPSKSQRLVSKWATKNVSHRGSIVDTQTHESLRQTATPMMRERERECVWAMRINEEKRW